MCCNRVVDFIGTPQSVFTVQYSALKGKSSLLGKILPFATVEGNNSRLAGSFVFLLGRWIFRLGKQPGAGKSRG
ncbi:hypothetical protein PUN28_000163 [Cardiocondyla obscurior]|uniref:Uncharacterized protein n=1 Tax=Cardiocondyla obscurior TaxID=286306 RepID=A0AAW2GY11_9HYME